MATPAFICDAVRSPFSGDGDAVLPVRANDLGATPLKELMTRNPQPTVCSTSTSPMAPGRRSRLVNVGPPIRAGEAIVGGFALDGNKDQAWVYLTGQRRVRKLPNPCCDTPTPATAGLMSFDEIEVWAGRIDRFDWKLVGKKEMYVPYNVNRLLQPRSDAEVIDRHYVKPDFMRWELHRVWVVDATLKQGRRHQAPKSRYYCDEDTWLCVLGDRWDANGQLWRPRGSQNLVAPDIPGTVSAAMGFNDLLSGSAFIGNRYNSKPSQYAVKPR